MEIKVICDSVKNHRIKITDHGDEEAQEDDLSYKEIFYSVIHGEIIKDYPDDKPYPSCLILGKNKNGNPIHSVWAYNNLNKWAVLITVYRPDPDLWINSKKRRRKK